MKRDLTAKENHLRTILLRLQKYNWSRADAAISLGLCVRTVRNAVNKLKKMGINIPKDPQHRESKRTIN